MDPVTDEPEGLPRRDLTGERIGKYLIRRKLGQGGMGAVFEAQHEDVGQRAVVKVLHPEFSREPRFVQRFLAEAKAASIVPHPGLVKLFDCNQLPDGTVYLLMEFLDGESLSQRMERLHAARDRMPHGDAVRITRQIASALGAVHAKGIVHRDLKPDNVILVPDPDSPSGERPKILDFGIAKLDGGGKKTTVGTIMGTPAYMAPEQCEGRSDIDDRADVYSLGVMLYEMLEGKQPFEADTLSALLRQQLIKPPPLLTSVSSSVSGLVMSMLAKDPAERPAMGQVVEAIDRLDRNLRSTQPEGTLPRPAVTGQRGRSRRALLGLGAALVLLGAGLAAWWVRSAAVPPAAVQGAPRPPPARPTAPAAAPPPASPGATPAPIPEPPGAGPKKEEKAPVPHFGDEGAKAPSKKPKAPRRSHARFID